MLFAAGKNLLYRLKSLDKRNVLICQVFSHCLAHDLTQVNIAFVVKADLLENLKFHAYGTLGNRRDIKDNAFLDRGTEAQFVFVFSAADDRPEEAILQLPDLRKTLRSYG